MTVEKMTVSEALCVAENIHCALRHSKSERVPKEVIALIVLAQRVRELSHAS